MESENIFAAWSCFSPDNHAGGNGGKGKEEGKEGGEGGQWLT